MTTPPVVHLHCHSHYSLLDGASPIDGMIGRAKEELGMNALAITDHGNLYAAPPLRNSEGADLSQRASPFFVGGRKRRPTSRAAHLLI